jgi:Carbohydrate esterase, sialic acid-specific acetylesterase
VLCPQLVRKNLEDSLMKSPFRIAPTGMENQRTRFRGTGRWIITFFALAAGASFLTCGVQDHNKPQPVVVGGTGGQPGSGIGTGGATVPGTGGQASTATGGATVTGTGGTVAGGPGTGGGVVVGSGGATTGSGGSTGAAGPSGITINIAGNIVPKEKAIVFIHFGHSNMRGQASTPASLNSFFYTTQPGLWMYKGQAAGGFVPAKEETAPENTTITTAGPGMALLRTAAAAAPADYHFISIGRGNGSSPSTDFVKGGLYYSTFMDRAMELKGKVTFGGIFIMLGITERHLPTAQQPGFPARMQQIVADIRADLGEPNLPVLQCDYEQLATGTLAPTGSVGVVVMPMVRSLPGLIPNLELVPTNGPGFGMQDDHHFDFTGHKLWAERAIGIMQTKGWFPWTK